MTTLITGGTGKTGLALAKLLHKANHPVLITSRAGKSPEPFKAVKFDWFDPTTFENPFDADHSIERVYLVGPSVLDMLLYVKPFIDLALSKGVKRFVFLSGSHAPAGAVMPWKVHEYLLKIGVDHVVLRPTWFQENFGSVFLYTIREQNKIFTATQDGRIPFVSVQDIAEVAFDALTGGNIDRKEIIVNGPELLSYDEVHTKFENSIKPNKSQLQAAKSLSTVLGREITHEKISGEQQEKTLTSFGLDEQYSKLLVDIERGAAAGKDQESFESKDERNFIGRRTILTYFQDNRELWIKA